MDRSSPKMMPADAVSTIVIPEERLPRGRARNSGPGTVTSTPSRPTDLAEGTSMEETHEQRVNRELGELLNELRVALPGVQVLFGFLLTTPFQAGFARISEFERDVYFATLLSTAAATVLLVAPAAQHRLLFRKRDKEAMLLRFNRYAVMGLLFLGASLCGATLLVTSLLFALSAAVSTAVAVAVGIAGLWVVRPLMLRAATRPTGEGAPGPSA